MDNTIKYDEGGQIQRHKSWNELSLSEKSEMIKVAVMNGITDLPTIKEKYNEFAEGGDTKELWTMEDEAKYREWRNSLPDNLRLTNDNDYDMRGAFKAGMQPTLESDGLYHLGSRDPETGRILKAPHHPTYLQAINTDARMGYYPIVDDKGQTYTQTWVGNLFADGGIHIKPENRGKFTALKERTGHSATWFKEHGTPAQKKMATFALNARKWKHGDGGELNTYDEPQTALGGGLDEEYKYATTYLPEVTVTPTRAQKEQAWRKKEGNIAKFLISRPTLPNLLSAAEHYANSIPGLRTAPSEITGIIASEPLLPDVKNAAQLMKVGKVARAFEDAIKGVKSVPQITTTKIGVNRDMPDFMKLMQKVDKSLPILSKEKSAEISKYANSQKNAVTQLRERMSDPKYAQMIRSNSNPEFMVEGNPVYIEGYDSEDRKNIYNFLTDKIMGMTDDPFQQVNYYADASNAVQNNSAFALPHTKYAFIPKKNTLLDREFVKMASDNAGKQYQYSIIKAHEGSHVLSHPNKESPLHQYLSGFDGDYFGYQRDAELSARGTQLKNYFDKKELSADDLKYASQYYVEDTGIDNKMTSMFNQIKTAAKKEPDIWKKMAKWMSSTSPVWMSGIINTQHKD